MNISPLKQECNLLLAAMLGEQNVKSWWQSRNSSFDMKTAEQQWELAPVVVYSYLLAHRAGDYS